MLLTKSGASSHQHIALGSLLAIDSHELESPIVLHPNPDNVEPEGSIAYLLIYMVAFL